MISLGNVDSIYTIKIFFVKVTIIFFCFKKMNLAEQKLTHFGKAQNSAESRIRHLDAST